MIKAFTLSVALALLTATAWAQAPILQTGTIVPGHIPVWSDLGVQGDSGSSSAPNPSIPATSLGLVGVGTPLCIYDSPIAGLAGYHQLCLGANSSSQGLISYNAFGGATSLPLILNINGLTIDLSTLSPASITGIPIAETNTILQGISTVTTGTIMRTGFAAAGDSSPVTYIASGSPCSLNAGNGDGGSQVKSADNKCWLASFSAAPVDIRVWGAKCDGSTDDSATLITADAATGFGQLGVLGTCRLANNVTLVHSLYIGPQGALSVNVAKTLTTSSVDSDAVSPFPGAGTVANGTATNTTLQNYKAMSLAPLAGTIDQGLNSSHTAAGTSSSVTGFSLNHIVVDSDFVNLNTNQFGVGFNVDYVIGKTSDPTNSALVRGGREAIQATTYLKNPTDPSVGNTNRNYVGAQFQSRATSGDNGTDWNAKVTSAGAIIGLGGQGSALSGATNLLHVAGAEFNSDCEPGSSGFLCSGISVVGQGGDSGANWKYRSAIDIGGIAGSIGYDYGIFLNDFHTAAPMKAGTSILIGSDGAVHSMGSLIDLPNYIFGDYILRVANTRITPDGVISAWNGGAIGKVTMGPGDATHTGNFSLYKWDGSTRYMVLGGDTTSTVTLTLQNSANFNFDTGGGTFFMDGNAGVSCAVAVPAHITVVKGIVTVCN